MCMTMPEGDSVCVSLSSMGLEGAVGAWGGVGGVQWLCWQSLAWTCPEVVLLSGVNLCA